MRIVHILRKPLSEGTVAANVLKHGAGGLNIDASRVGLPFVSAGGNNFDVWRSGEGREDRPPIHGKPTSTVRSGRWPANVILHHLDGCRCEVTKRVKGTGPRAGGGKESVANWICEPGCPVKALDNQSRRDTTTGASRFFKQVGGTKDSG